MWIYVHVSDSLCHTPNTTVNQLYSKNFVKSYYGQQQQLSRFSRVRLCATPWTAAHWAPPSLGFSRQEHGVGCHFLLQCRKVKSESESEVVSDPQRPHGLQPTRLLYPWDFPGKSTGVGCHCLLRLNHWESPITCFRWTVFFFLYNTALCVIF